MKKCIALLLILSFSAVIPTVEAKEADAEYVAKPGQNVVVSCGEKLADESVLVSFGVKLPYETANENFAVTINSSDGEIVSFLEFSDANYRTAGAKLLGVDSDTGHMISGEQRDVSCAFYGGMRYYVFNIAEELDAPGEYYIDRENSVLYYYPSESFNKNSRAGISQLGADLVSISNASYINFEGIKFLESRESGIVMNNCSDINVSDYEVSNIGKNGVMINNCKNIVFDGGKIYNIARVGFNIAETINNELTESGNILKNSEVYRCSRASGGTVSAIILAGVGNKILDCRIHDCPSTAIGMSGLKHLIQDSEFYNFCEYISDWGVIYIGRSWAYYGNTIKNNYFHDIDKKV